MAERLVGVQAPAFEMETALGNGEEFGKVSLEGYKGKWLVMFFYPLDFTFICPTEITAFSDAAAQFSELNAEVLAVSTDSVHSHKAWINNGLGKLDIQIASDNNHQVSRDYGVLIEDKGIALRGLFIIDPDGVLQYSVNHNTNIGRNVEETLRVLQALQSGGLCGINWKPGQPNL